MKINSIGDKMKKPKWWDEYEIKARYIPTFVSVIPLVHFLLLFLGDKFWSDIISDIDWMLVVANLGMSLLLVLFLVQVQCGFAKHWIEEPVFGQGGKFFPTTDMLLLKGGYFSLSKKNEIREKVSNSTKHNFATLDEENQNPENARLQAREAIGIVKRSVGRGNKTFSYNVRYGFFRNLTGGILWSFVGSIGCSVLYFKNKNFKAMSLFITIALVYTTLFLFKKQVLNKFAYSYADTLFSEYLNIGDK